jgi:Helix-turn-helix domain
MYPKVNLVDRAREPRKGPHYRGRIRSFAFSGERLKVAREAAGFRREEVSIATGRSIWSIIGYETGKTEPPASVISDMAAMLGVEPGDFFAPAA